MEPYPLGDIPQVNARILDAATLAHSRALTAATPQDATYEIARLQGAEVAFKIPAPAFLGHLQHFSQRSRPAVDNAICDLAAQYNKIKDFAEEVIWKHACRARLRHVSIPSIALEILKTCRSPDQIVDRTLDMRNEFRGLRQKMNELARILSDPSLGVERYLSLTKKWEEEWNTLASACMDCRMGLGISDFNLLANGYQLNSAINSEDYLAAIIAGLQILSRGDQYFRQQLFRPIRTPVRNYLRTTRHETCRTVSRIWDISPKKVEHQMGLIASADDSVWRLVCSKVRNDNGKIPIRRLSA